MPKRNLLRALMICLAALFLLGGCGGSSGGTGIETVEVRGIILNQSGAPVGGINIAVTGPLGMDGGVSQDDGTYSYSLRLRAGDSVLFEFDGENLSAESLIANIPERVRSFTVTFLILSDSEIIPSEIVYTLSDGSTTTIISDPAPTETS